VPNKVSHAIFLFRFPGGESYKDLIRRLESVVVDMEQQVIPTLVVSHVSTLQLLVAYFRRSPVKECMHIEVPLHTVLKFAPARGGGWTETQIPLLPQFQQAESGIERSNSEDREAFKYSKPSTRHFGYQPEFSEPPSPTPIWGDHMRRSSSLSMSSTARTPSSM
jgi:broad specificity phosphatase PhoE